MTESNLKLEAQITAKHELIACMCVVTFKEEGDRRGMIERIESLTLGEDFPESFERSQFKVHLTSGDIVVVPGSAISAIESTPAGSHSKPNKRAPGKKGRKARTKKMAAQKSASQSARMSKSAATGRIRKAKSRKARNG